MQVAVISDLHLGRKNKLDQFNRNPGAEAQLYQLLKYLENHVDRIVLLGDVFETLRGPTLNQKKELRAVLKHYPLFAEKVLCNEKYVLVKGNHDLVTGEILNAMEFLTIKENNTKIVLFHGHQLDPYVADFWTRNFEKVGVWGGGWLERLGVDITRGGNIRSKDKALNDKWKFGRFELTATLMGRKMGADVIVTGHSHHPMKVEVGDHLFLNSGSRVCGRQDMIILDTDAGEYEVYKQFDVRSQNQEDPLIDMDLS